MRIHRLSVLSLLSVSLLATPVDAKVAKAVKVATPDIVAAATHIDLEVAELAKDGTRRAMVLTLSLPDRSGHGGAPPAQIARVVRGDGSSMIVTATVR